ncbi:PotD/PotF family extracellular solute-binding protein [Bradyrhizobium sp. RT11b]|uniref:ABC transporter substrate-binding protein n=1 Tax=Bradyrhizobium sp. RT11b TaxID=3156332 RepID=UPI003396380D
MTVVLSRRSFLAFSAGTYLGTFWCTSATAQSKNLVAVEWGTYINTTQALSKKLSIADVKWELHAGGAAAILAKIKASWPRVNYDVVTAWSPVFLPMVQEGWVETLNPQEMPNLRDIPDQLFIKDSNGAIKAAPRVVNPQMWGYRTDLCPFKVIKMQDLLDPRLKGKVLFPGPVLNTGMQLVSIARALGGDERNMEPAWDFVKKLAQSGNIGRVSASDSETFNSLSTGETCLGFATATGFMRLIDAKLPITTLGKMPPESGFKAAIAMEGWAILKGGNVPTAKAWVNAMLAPDVNGDFAERTFAIPANSKAPISARLDPVRFGPADYAEHTYVPDYGYISGQLNSWTQRWEKEIAPLL